MRRLCWTLRPGGWYGGAGLCRVPQRQSPVRRWGYVLEPSITAIPPANSSLVQCAHSPSSDRKPWQRLPRWRGLRAWPPQIGQECSGLKRCKLVTVITAPLPLRPLGLSGVVQVFAKLPTLNHCGRIYPTSLSPLTGGLFLSPPEVAASGFLLVSGGGSPSNSAASRRKRRSVSGAGWTPASTVMVGLVLFLEVITA